MEKDILNFETDIKVTPIKWLWYPYIPIGKITVLQGSSGIGETMLALNIAAALSKGEMFPLDTDRREPIKILYNTVEDGLDGIIIKRRLLAVGADCNRIYTISEPMPDKELAYRVAATGAKLLILDSMEAYIIGRPNTTPPVFTYLNRIAEESECAVIFIGRKVFNDYMVTAARSVLTVTQDPKGKSFFTIEHTKCSLAPKGISLSFRTNRKGKIFFSKM